MKVNRITMRKSSGFQFSITTSIVDTPKGAIRTIEIKDHEVMMGDLEPTDTMCLIFNENAPDTNTQQLKSFCKFVLKDIEREERKKKLKKRISFLNKK